MPYSPWVEYNYDKNKQPELKFSWEELQEYYISDESTSNIIIDHRTINRDFGIKISDIKENIRIIIDHLYDKLLTLDIIL